MKEHALICSPGPIREDAIAGSVLDSCEVCGCDVVLAPSGQAMVSAEPDKWTLLCILCGVLMISSDPEPEIGDPTPDQIAELREHQSRF